MSDQKQTQPSPEKPAVPYQKYKDFKWQNPDQFKNINKLFILYFSFDISILFQN